MKRICIVLPKLTAGGTERTAAELANYLVSMNIDVSILLMYKYPHFFNLDKRVKIIEPEPEIRRKLGRVLYLPYLLLFLRKNLKNLKPDSILCLGYILFSLIAAWGIKSTVVISNRSSPYRVRFPKMKILNFLYKFLYRILKNRVDGIIAQTQVSADVYKKSFKCPIIVIPNFLKEMEYFPQVEKGNVIITVGRAVPEKGQKHFIDVVKKLSHNNMDFILLGDGPQLSDLKTYAKKLNVMDRIEFVGFSNEVDKFLAQSKVFVFTSLTEGYPNAIIEAMAHGCVPVSFNCVAGPSDIIKHGVNGYLVEVGDTDRMAHHIQNLFHNEGLLADMSINSQEVRDTNSLNTIGKLYLDFLLLKKNK